MSSHEEAEPAGNPPAQRRPEINVNVPESTRRWAREFQAANDAQRRRYMRTIAPALAEAAKAQRQFDAMRLTPSIVETLSSYRSAAERVAAETTSIQRAAGLTKDLPMARMAEAAKLGPVSRAHELMKDLQVSRMPDLPSMREIHAATGWTSSIDKAMSIAAEASRASVLGKDGARSLAALQAAAKVPDVPVHIPVARGDYEMRHPAPDTRGRDAQIATAERLGDLIEVVTALVDHTVAGQEEERLRRAEDRREHRVTRTREELLGILVVFLSALAVSVPTGLAWGRTGGLVGLGVGFLVAGGAVGAILWRTRPKKDEQ